MDARRTSTPRANSFCRTERIAPGGDDDAGFGDEPAVSVRRAWLAIERRGASHVGGTVDGNSAVIGDHWQAHEAGHAGRDPEDGRSFPYCATGKRGVALLAFIA